MYMNGFQCRITGDVGDQPIGKPGLPRQCGEDAASGHPANPSNCTVGPKNPFYWDQTERNNMFEGIYDAPTYSLRYDFPDGAQPNLFMDATIGGTPAPVQNNSPPPSSSPAPAPSDTPAPAASSPAAAAPPPADTPAPASTTPAAPPPPPPPSTEAAVTTSTSSIVSAVTEVASTPAASPVTTSAASGATQKCRPRNGKKKRSAVQRHLKKRLTQDGLSIAH